MREQARPSTTTDPRLWTVLSVVAAAGVLVRLHRVWTIVSEHSAEAAVSATLGYVALLACIVAAVVVRDDRFHRVVDGVVLAVVVTLQLLQIPALAATDVVKLGDEGRLTDAAIASIRHGLDPYTRTFPATAHETVTALMNGRAVDRFDYPPLSAVLGAAGGWLWSDLAHAAVLDVVAMSLAAVIAFLVLPQTLRPAATIGVLSLSLVASRATVGEPVVIALPFLLVACLHWTDIGLPDHRRGDLVRGTCLGLAMATQQLVWFLVPFLLVAVWSLRRSTRSPLGAAGTLVPIGAAAGLAFTVVNLPFALAAPGAWEHGLIDVFTQHAIPYGPGLPTLSIALLHGTGGLATFTLGAALVYAALLLALALLPRQLGPAFAVLPMICFLFSVRSEDTYYLAFAPLWLVLAAATPRAATRAATGLLERRGATSFPRPWVGALVAVSFVPAVACVALAFAAAPALTVSVTGVSRPNAPGTMRAVVVEVTNHSRRTLRPTFKVFAEAILGPARILSGPGRVGPHASATYVLSAPVSVLAQKQTERVVALTDDPESASVGFLTRAERFATTPKELLRITCGCRSAHSGRCPCRSSY